MKTQRPRLVLTGAALAVGAAGLGAFAAVGLGDGSESPHARTVQGAPVALTVANVDGAARTAGVQARRGTRRGPVITHLITANPATAFPSSSTFIALRCRRRFGQPIGGAVVTNGVKEMAQSISSRFNPNTGSTPKRTYFVGVANTSAAEQTFDGTLVCAKGIRVR